MTNSANSANSAIPVYPSPCVEACGPLLPGLDVCRQHAEQERNVLAYQLQRLDDKIRWFQTREHKLSVAIYVTDHPVTIVPEGESGRTRARATQRPRQNGGQGGMDNATVTNEIAKLKAELDRIQRERELAH